MKRIDILTAFELEINKIDDAVNKPATDDSLYWLNLAVNKFVKERFNGNSPHYTSYEQNEKRTRDLHNLYVREQLFEDNTSYWPERSTFKTQSFNWPENLMYMLNEDVKITDMYGNNSYDTSVFECTADNFMYRITNSLTDFHYRHKKARPLRVRIGMINGCYKAILITDGKYKVSEYYVSYLKCPDKITDEDPDDTSVEYTDFEDDVWYEIIKIAAQMYIENQSEQRYNTLTNEVLTQE